MIPLSRGNSKKINKDWIEDVYGNLKQGQSARGTVGCRCFKQEIQGEESENRCAVSVTRTAKGLEYCCFKSSCNLGSGICGSGNAWSGFEPPAIDDGKHSGYRKKVSSEFALPYGVVEGATGSRFDWLQQFSIGRVEIARYSIREHPADPGGLYFPINDLAGDFTGYVRRQIAASGTGSGGDGGTPKWVSRVPPGTLALSKPWRKDKIVFVVEDVPSSIRLGKMVNSVALLGSELTKHHIPNLIKLLNAKKPPMVVIALDPDAYDKAKKMQKVLTGVWPGVKVLKTDADPKWWSDEQLEEVLNKL